MRKVRVVESERPRTWLDRARFYLNPRYLNAASTARTGLGFVATFAERHLPGRFRSGRLTAIFNYLPISDSLVTAGQPTETQFTAVKAAGIARVINLAPHGLENSLPDEAGLVTGLGMDYVHIPVDFENPTESDFTQFCTAMQAAGTHPVLVHCAANMRVSAFVYRYRTQILGEPRHTAEQDLRKIWKPFGTWKEFIETGAR
jgi:uncharacterized protein (TIGR01244 family)